MADPKPKPRRPVKKTKQPPAKKLAKSRTRKPAPVVVDTTHLPTGRVKGALARHQAFAQELFAHNDGRLAYLRIYYPTGTPPGAKVIETAVLKLKKHKNVRAELDRLEQIHAAELAAKKAAAEASAQQAVRTAIATREEILEFQTRVMRANGADFLAEERDLFTITQTRRLAPVRHDKEGNEIPHPDADDAGYILEETRRPPDIKERLKASDQLAEIQGFKKVDLGKPTLDAFSSMLARIRGGGMAEQHA